MRGKDFDKKFMSTIQNYQEALACLEVAARCLRADMKHSDFGATPRYRKHDTAPPDQRNTAHQRLRPSHGDVQWTTARHTGNYNNRNEGGRSVEYYRDDGLPTDHHVDLHTTANLPTAQPTTTGGTRGGIAIPLPSSSSRNNFPLGNSNRPSRPSFSYHDNENINVINNTGSGGIQRSNDRFSNIGSRLQGVGMDSGSSSNIRGDSPSHCRDTKDVDYAMLEGLVERCSEAINAIQADLQTDNVLVKDSLHSLLQSLLLHKLLLERLKDKGQNHSNAAASAAATTASAAAAAAVAGPATAGAADDKQAEKGNSSVMVAVESMRSDGAAAAADGGLDAVVGLEEVKEILQETFLWPTQFPHLFTEGGPLSPWTRLLLYGPPGTGKTRLARALAADLCCPLYTVTPAALLSCWLGDTEKIIRELFRRVGSEAGPVIVFLDEMDSLCRTRTSAEDDSTRRIKTELLVHLDSDNRSHSSTNGPARYNTNDFNDDYHPLDDLIFDGDAQYGDSDQTNDRFNASRFVGSDAPVHRNSFLNDSNVSSSAAIALNAGVANNIIDPMFNRNCFINNSISTGVAGSSGGIANLNNSMSDVCLPEAKNRRNGNDGNATKVFVIAATNCPWDVDPAFLRRFQRRCYVPLPQRCERRSLLEAGLSGCSTSAVTERDWDAVLDATEGYSGADLHTLATAAAFRPLRQLHTARFWCFTNDNMIMPCSDDTLGAMQYTLDKLPPNRVTVRGLVGEDLLDAQRCTPRSVPASLLRQYSNFQDT